MLRGGQGASHATADGAGASRFGCRFARARTRTSRAREWLEPAHARPGLRTAHIAALRAALAAALRAGSRSVHVEPAIDAAGEPVRAADRGRRAGEPHLQRKL